MKNKNDYFIKHYQELKNKNLKVLENVPIENKEVRDKLTKEIERLDKGLNV